MREERLRLDVVYFTAKTIPMNLSLNKEEMEEFIVVTKQRFIDGCRRMRLSNRKVGWCVATTNSRLGVTLCPTRLVESEGDMKRLTTM